MCAVGMAGSFGGGGTWWADIAGSSRGTGARAAIVSTRGLRAISLVGAASRTIGSTHSGLGAKSASAAWRAFIVGPRRSLRSSRWGDRLNKATPHKSPPPRVAKRVRDFQRAELRKLGSWFDISRIPPCLKALRDATGRRDFALRFRSRTDLLEVLADLAGGVDPVDRGIVIRHRVPTHRPCQQPIRLFNIMAGPRFEAFQSVLC